MKKKIYNFYLYILHILVFVSCYLNSPKLCAYFIKLSLFKQKSLKRKVNSEKITLVLYRAIGERDVRIIEKSSNKIPQILFMRRSIVKLVFYYFSGRRKIFFNYSKAGLSVNQMDYFNQDKKNRIKLDLFWEDVIFNLKSFYNNKIFNLVTFNFNYFEEIPLYAACKKNNLPVKLWFKECFRSDPEIEYFIKEHRYGHVFPLFEKISVYNKFMKNALIALDKSNSKKITVNGCPRIFDYINKKKYYKQVKDILFLSFHTKSGIPHYRNYLDNVKKTPLYEKNKKINWNITYDKTIKILNELSNNQNVNVVIKRKKSSGYKSSIKINKKIKIFEENTAQKYINQADIIIGQNSASTIEALVNGKHVFVPFFEKKKILRKYLYNFNQQIIYGSEKKMKKNILNLINKKFMFPIKNAKNQKTIYYYYGSSKNVVKIYVNFLNS